MKKIFRKAVTVLSSVALVGATIGGAVAASYPSPFTSNTAVVYGANAAPSDYSAAMSIVSNLDSVATGTTLSGGSGVTEDQVPLGGSIVSGKIVASLTDSKIPSLLDERMSWDDGTGSSNYDIDEQIVITSANVNLKTTFDDNDFTENVAMTNDKGIEYRFVFGTDLNVTAVGTANADDLYLNILGKQYEITSMTADSFTVVTSEKYSLSSGESVTVGGKTFTVNSIFDGSVEVNGEIIATSGTKKIDGMRVEVDTIGYHANAPELSRVVLKIGEDISKTYTDGEEYIGEDENDPEWIWTIPTGLGDAADYIGVKYNYKQTRDTDEVVYVGGSYVLPENFAEIKFDGLTEVDYEDFRIYFDDTEDLWDNTDLTSTAQVQDAPVLIIESVDGRKDSITLSDGNETSKIYLRWANTTQDILDDTTNASLEVYFSDVDGVVQDAIKPRYSAHYVSDANETFTGANITNADIGDIIVGDTTIAIRADVSSGNLQLRFTDGGAGQSFTADIGGVALGGDEGKLLWFGGDSESTDKEDGLAGDLLVAGTSVGTYDNDIMLQQGTVVKTPESNLDNDEVVFSVPNDRVYGIVSVLAGGTATGESGAVILKDTETSSMSGKNLVVVGGSAINSVAADLLGGAYSEGAFTAATGVDAGKFLIQSFDRAGETALLVAGYHAADTEKAVTYLLNQDVDTTVGKKYIGTSATEATTVVA
ncbi:MAG: hypothetical protein WC494_02425 [Candidatus Pacearchaeota archaeon]